LLAVNEALEQLTLIEPEKAQLVKLRYFVGMNLEEAAAALGISEPTAKRWWAYARAWLFNEIRSWPHEVLRGESGASTGVISQASENTHHEDLH
jgi:DNA-directed RNA polymerase specialized sigma24 family protein